MSGVAVIEHKAGIESSFCKTAIARSDSPVCAATRARTSSANGTADGIFLDRVRGHGLLGQSQCSGFVTKAHVGQREITNEFRILRLFFVQWLQFAARLLPTFLGGGMVAGDFLRPAQPKAQFTIEETQRWIRLGQYLL